MEEEPGCQGEDQEDKWTRRKVRSNPANQSRYPQASFSIGPELSQPKPEAPNARAPTPNKNIIRLRARNTKKNNTLTTRARTPPLFLGILQARNQRVLGAPCQFLIHGFLRSSPLLIQELGDFLDRWFLDCPAMSVSSSPMCGAGDTGMRIVVWFRRDLRVEDNPALAAAARAGGEVVPAYVWSPEEDGPYHPGRVSRWWISQSLQHLDASLRRLGAGKLVTRRSADAVVALLQLVRDTGATHVYFNHLYGLFFQLSFLLNKVLLYCYWWTVVSRIPLLVCSSFKIDSTIYRYSYMQVYFLLFFFSVFI